MSLLNRFLFISIFLFSGCFLDGGADTPSLKVQYARKVRNQTIVDVSSNTHLAASGTGGQMLHQIQKLCLMFDSNRELEEEEARWLVLFAANALLTRTNQHEEIQPYLENRPFEPKNVEIKIFVTTKKTSENAEKIRVVSLINGRIKYKTSSLVPAPLVTIKEESYEEAVAIVEAGPCISHLRGQVGSLSRLLQHFYYEAAISR